MMIGYKRYLGVKYCVLLHCVEPWAGKLITISGTNPRWKDICIVVVFLCLVMGNVRYSLLKCMVSFVFEIYTKAPKF